MNTEPLEPLVATKNDSASLHVLTQIKDIFEFNNFLQVCTFVYNVYVRRRYKVGIGPLLFQKLELGLKLEPKNEAMLELRLE